MQIIIFLVTFIMQIMASLKEIKASTQFGPSMEYLTYIMGLIHPLTRKAFSKNLMMTAGLHIKRRRF